MSSSTSQAAVTVRVDRDQRLSNSEIPLTFGSVNGTTAIIRRQISASQEQRYDGDFNRKSSPLQQLSVNSSSSSSGVNQTSSTEEDDGSIDKKKTTQNKQSRERTIKKSNSVDEDDGIMKQKNKTTETKTKKKSLFIRCFQAPAVDDDNYIPIKETSPTDKKKHTSDVEKTISEDTDDDGVQKRKDSFKKQISSKSNSSNEQSDENKVGRRAPKTGGTYAVVNLSDRPSIDNLVVDYKLAIDNTDGAISQSSTPEKNSASPLIDSVNEKIPVEIHDPKHRKCPDKFHYETIPTDETQVARTNSIDSSPTSSQNKPYFSRTISSCITQPHTPPSPNEKNPNKYNSSHSKIKNDMHRILIDNPIQSIMKTIRTISIHVNVQQRQQPKREINYAQIQERKERMNRRIRARTRWFVAYTLIRNPRLISYRKRALEEERLFLLNLKQARQREQQARKTLKSNQKAVSVTNNKKSETSRNPQNKTMAPTCKETEHRSTSLSKIDNDFRILLGQSTPIPV